MNKRLSLIASLIKPGIGFVDVGTDHGYIPIHMAQNGYNGCIIASDINRGPLDSAIQNASDAGLRNRIRFSLCDGLNGIDPQSIDTVVIAGMGGDLICRILDEADWVASPRYRLILQPMTKSEILRYWLNNNNFEIDGEYLTEDGGKLYQVISAHHSWSPAPLSDAEIFCGSAGLVLNEELYKKRIDTLIARFSRSLSGMTAGDRESYKLEYVRNILDGLMELRSNYDNDQ